MAKKQFKVLSDGSCTKLYYIEDDEIAGMKSQCSADLKAIQVSHETKFPDVTCVHATSTSLSKFMETYSAAAVGAPLPQMLTSLLRCVGGKQNILSKRGICHPAAAVCAGDFHGERVAFLEGR